MLHHCSNFRAWTTVSSNSWNAQQQGGLSSDSKSSQPSWLCPSDPDTWSPSLSGPDGISPPACHSLNLSSQETGPYVKIGSASWRSCCSPGFWKQSACCWRVLCSFWPYCCQESSSLPEQMPSMFPVPLRSLSFWTLDLWWAAGSEDQQRCQLSTSPWLIKTIIRHGILPSPTSSKMLHTCVHVNKNIKNDMVAIAQKLDLIEQNQWDFWIQRIRFVPNQLKERRQQICCWPVLFIYSIIF